MSQKISIVIPTYNESQNIVSLIKKISETMAESTLSKDTTAEIIVVDDNSPDGTAAACQSVRSECCPVKVIIRSDERGLGSAVGRGILEAAGDTIVVMDADFSHDCAMIPQLALALNGGPIDVAIASRFVQGGRCLLHPTFYSAAGC